jgi:hypothetical protein
MAAGDLVAWPTGRDLRGYLLKQGVTNVVDTPFHDDVVDAVCTHVAALQGRSFTDDIPQSVRLAILIQAHRLSRRKDSPEGVAGFGPDGNAIRLTRLDPDVAELLAPDMRIPIVGA